MINHKANGIDARKQWNLDNSIVAFGHPSVNANQAKNLRAVARQRGGTPRHIVNPFTVIEDLRK